jgi:ribonuclease HI
MQKSATAKQRMIVFVDGTGGQEGAMSGYAWTIPSVAAMVQWKAGLTCNQAEFWALISALRWLPKGSCAVIYTDSQIVARNYSGEYRTSHPNMLPLLTKVRTLIKLRNLDIEIRWISRWENKADELLRRRIGL